MSATTQSQWEKLLNSSRRKADETGSRKASPQASSGHEELRTEIERDYDRILFSTPVRRLADKTQVFPLDRNDSVRTRLTHSHEVSNLARSMGTALVWKKKVAEEISDSCRNIPALLAAVGLAHDLGNPPFGHQGEAAIQSWFQKNKKAVLEEKGLSEQQKQDFLRFEGNAQGFRLVTKLQLLNDNYGLDLTYASLAALMKYTTHSADIDKNIAAKKKHGFFQSEEAIAKDVLEQVGLSLGKRHSLAYVMEACDDIAYVVLDAEDSIKKGLASFGDLIAHLKHHSNGDREIDNLVRESEEKHAEYRRGASLSPAELNDISMQRFRVFAIGRLVSAAIDAFGENQKTLISGEFKGTLLGASRCEKLRSNLKEFSLRHGYRHKTVLEVELSGYNVIHDLLDIFWSAIIDRDLPAETNSKRSQPFPAYVYTRISENYRRIFEDSGSTDLPLRYRECLLLTDMISGMTDSFAVDLRNELVALRGNYKLVV